MFSKFFDIFSLFHNNFPLEKDVTLYLNKLEIPLSKEVVEISPVVLEKKLKK